VPRTPPGRKVQDYGRRQRRGVKLHEPQPRASVSKLFPEGNYGILKTHDGREIYFHRNSVLEPEFDRLQKRMTVYYAEEQDPSLIWRSHPCESLLPRSLFSLP
jgi:hypothetical protein